MEVCVFRMFRRTAENHSDHFRRKRNEERSVFIRILCTVECGFNFRTLTLSYAVRSDRNLLDILADITVIYVD